MASSIIAAGLQGVQRGLSSAADDAQRVSESFSPNAREDATDALVALKLDQHAVEASAKVIKVGNVLQQSILDVLA